ncbi:MAG: glycosyltransferase family 4 protein [Planctomycetaceae bacterium]
MDGRRLTVMQMLPALDGGGVESSALEMSEEIVRAGHRSIVVSSGGPLVGQLELHGAEHIELPITKRHLVGSLRAVSRLKEILRAEQVDVLHARSRHPAWVAWLAWRKLPAAWRPRFVTTAHGLYSVNPYSAIMAKGEKVIAVSETVRDYLLSSFPRLLDLDTVETIYEGIDQLNYTPDFRPSEQWLSRWKQEHPALQQRPLLTLPGRITRLKGHFDFLTAIHQLKQRGTLVNGLIVGGVDPRRRHYAQEVECRIVELGLQDHVMMLPHRLDLREILSVSDVVLSLSSNPPEAFGRTVVEALSLGTPVVGYDHGGAAEILRTLFPAGRVTPGDVAEVVRQIEACIETNQEIHPNLQFTRQHMSETTIRLYENIAA